MAEFVHHRGQHLIIPPSEERDIESTSNRHRVGLISKLFRHRFDAETNLISHWTGAAHALTECGGGVRVGPNCHVSLLALEIICSVNY